MTVYSNFLSLINGVARTVNLSANTLSLGALQLNGATSGNLTQLANATTTSYSVTWPAAQGGVSTFLENDGSGNLSWSASVGSFANQQLSNLSGTVAINLSLTPGTDNSINLGSASKSWAAANIHVLNDGSSVASVDVYNRLLKDAAGVASVDYANRALKDTAGATQLTWSTSGLQLTANALDFNSHKGINLTDPTNPQDAATKNYADNLAHGLSWKEVVRSATTAPLAGTYVYNNGTSGVGATITQNGTISGNSLNPQDGVTLAVNDRLLVQNETGGNQPYNGIYVVTQVGDGATIPYILTRATDADTAAKLTWATVEVGSDASTQAGYIQRESADITTIGTDNVTFVNVSHGLNWTFNNGLSVTGNQVNVAPGDTSLTATTGSLVVRLNAAGAIITSSGLMINIAATNPGLAITSNAIDVKYNPAGAIIASSSGITTNVDNSSIEISSNALRIKTTAYDQVTITGGSGTAASVASSPATKRVLVAGQTFTANTSYAVRWGLTANSETAGRIYACDTTTSSFDLFYCIGMASSGTTVNAGGNITVTTLGSFNLGTADTAFGSGTDGAPVFISTSGAFTLTAPSASGTAVTRIGVVQVRSATAASNIIDVAPHVVGVN